MRSDTAAPRRTRLRPGDARMVGIALVAIALWDLGWYLGRHAWSDVHNLHVLIERAKQQELGDRPLPALSTTTTLPKD